MRTAVVVVADAVVAIIVFVVVVTVAEGVVELTFVFVFGQSHGSDRASHRSVCTPC